MEFLLNVKELRLKPLSGQPGKMFLEMEGEGQVCAADIQPTTDFEIVNPELLLATLDTADARLYVEFDVEPGIGYREAESGDNLPPEVIGVDAVFSPIRKVNYTVEPTYIGRETKYERLWLEVWTDGTLSALDAVSRSASLLMGQLSPFADMANLSKSEDEGKLAADAIPDEKYNMPVEQLDLSVRTMNCLRHAAISTVGEILEKGEKELLLLRNFGQKSMKEIEERLTTMGLSLHAKTEDSPSEDDDEREPE
jgi:DNA-directed RNA polymerase subunit alpha